MRSNRGKGTKGNGQAGRGRGTGFGGGGQGFGGIGDGAGGTPETTGRFLVLFREDAGEEGVKLLKNRAGVDVAAASEMRSAGDGGEISGDADAVHFEKIGVAVVRGDPSQYSSVAAESGEGSAILAVEPERVVYALGAAADEETAGGTTASTRIAPEAMPRESLGLSAPMVEDLLQPSQPPAGFEPIQPAPAPTPAQVASKLTIDYLVGYRDAIANLVEEIRGSASEAERALFEREVGAAALSEALATWGLQVTRVTASARSGKGARVAVLDTGFDTTHPDFAGRQIQIQSFVPGQLPQDGHGHGTHCIGTSCGAKRPAILPRYGAAYGAAIAVGKVLNNAGSGQDGWILAGIDWAIRMKSRVISMSLGAPVGPGQGYSAVYEAVAQRALRANTLIIAAAGNDSNRAAGIYRPVGHPANCPSIMAVGALDANLRVANFSNRAINLNGGRVDIAAPGVNVYSSWPMPLRYRRLNGTSMATPHVAGIAAMWAEAFPNATAVGLYQLLVSHARPLNIPSVDVGAGLVQAP